MISCGRCHQHHASVQEVRACHGLAQEIPGLPGVTVADAASLADAGRVQNPRYGAVKELRRELKAALSALVPDHGNYRVACSLPGEDKVRFFRVDAPQKGKWAGCVFLKEQAGDEVYPVKGVAREEVIIRALLEDVKSALTLYGLELGSCGVCGRTLTDETSRERGIGPICWDKGVF